MTTPRIQGEARWLPAINKSGSALAARAAVRIAGTDAYGRYQLYYPDENDQTAEIGIIGPIAVATDAVCNVSQDWPLKAKYSGTAPSIGDDVGVQSGTPAVQGTQEGFRVIDRDTGEGWAEINPIRSAAQPPAAGCSNKCACYIGDYWRVPEGEPPDSPLGEHIESPEGCCLTCADFCLGEGLGQIEFDCGIIAAGWAGYDGNGVGCDIFFIQGPFPGKNITINGGFPHFETDVPVGTDGGWDYYLEIEIDFPNKCE